MTITVEVDGDQHLVDVPGWKSVADERREVDIFKMMKASENGVHIIRISQDDVWNNWREWKGPLEQAIKDASQAINQVGGRW